MKLKFFGAAQTVTGSQYVIEINGAQILLDCGLFQGRRAESYQRNLNFPFSPSHIQAAILSHAHIDHSGNFPNLVRRGFRGPIYATPATAHLANIMLLDSGHIQESDAEFVNKQRLKRGEPPVQPLYTLSDAAQVAQQFSPIGYRQVFEPVPGVRAQFFDAGHILGSAGVLLELQENGRQCRLWFSGDIGRRGLPLLRDPVLPEPVDVLVMECTYGYKLHADPQAAYDELRQVVGQAIERQGKVIIPAFAVGRTQELVYNLNMMIRSGEIPHLPIYVDSPLAVKASDIYLAHPECFDQETHEFATSYQFQTALEYPDLVYTRSVEESKSLNKRKGPMIIISASGMAEGGRVLHHLRNSIEDPRSTVLIVSWQAPHTLGRRLADREEKVRIFGEEFTRRANVETIGGFSAHAGQGLLVEYAQAAFSNGSLRTFLVHGEPRAAQALTEKLVQAGISDITYPQLSQEVEL
jgi:metallo-beta-lactamase family protein